MYRLPRGAIYKPPCVQLINNSFFAIHQVFALLTENVVWILCADSLSRPRIAFLFRAPPLLLFPFLMLSQLEVEQKDGERLVRGIGVVRVHPQDVKGTLPSVNESVMIFSVPSPSLHSVLTSAPENVESSPFRESVIGGVLRFRRVARSYRRCARTV